MVRSPRLALSVCLLLALLAVACGGDDDASADETTAPGTTSAGTEGGPEPELSPPASQFTLQLSDMPAGYLVNPNRTFQLDATGYGASSVFASDEEGEEMLNDWGYLSGFETEFQPERREIAVLEGSNYVFVESHLFEDNDGASAFYAHLRTVLAAARAQEVSIAGLANDSSAWRREVDKVPGSDVPAAHSWYIFRRGNLVTAVKVYGAATLVNADSSRTLAVVVDQRALGEIPAVGPTSTPTP